MIGSSGKYVRLFRISFLVPLIYLIVTYPAPVCAQGDLSAIVNQSIPAVVVVNVFNREGKWRGSGTGFFVREEGLLVTNRHVIDGKARAVARLSNREFLPVEGVVAEDNFGDLVLLALGVKGRSFPTLKLADAEIESGQPIVVIGSPFGEEGIVSKGIVSEVQDAPNLGKIIQHTATVSPGSSGSPVLNMRGEVIGVIFGKNESLNLAFSVERVKSLLLHIQATPRGLAEMLNQDEEIWLRLLLDSRDEELIDFLRRRIRLNPKNAMAHYYLGSALAKLSHIDEAIEAYKQAIQIEPENSSYYYNLGVSYIRLGNQSEAIAAFKQAVRTKPDNAEALLNLGFSYDALGHQKEAIKAYEQAIKIKPDFAEAHYNIGCTFINLGRYSEAIEAYRKAIGIKTDYADGYYSLGIAYLKTKNRSLAFEQYRILKNLDRTKAQKLLEQIDFKIF